ncbi:Flp pilus assembly complex ATPase component TadA [Clostridium estertheticum]|uniref:GspE/PulE family protein n=1 Tax=Clostridium estertheticum TaxID=238834 RepID=UPI001C0E2EC1|nr:GspE/PulE family protein [Clostridium estertheticum]MBU3198432.1 Flp pilus assembly complex ATPase component TadA [Clostridium estertheticum]WAG65112.1 Flp pilus assembly complex ATPase component TadA [Clostridium estertheticum]
MDNKIKRRIGDLLVQSGKLTVKQLRDALNIQKTLGKKLGELLVDEGIVTAEDIICAIEEQTGINRIKLESINIDKMAIKAVPQNVCEKNDLIPFGFNENRIKIAMWDPLNIYAIDDVSIASGFEVETYVALKDEIKKAIDRCYSDEQVLKAAAELSKEKANNNKVQAQQELPTIDDVKNAPVVKMVDYLIKNAIEARASDIHIEPFENNVRIRFRVDGQLQQISTLGVDTLSALVARIKILANLNIAEKRTPQDGKIIMTVEDKTVDVRVSILPTVYGEKVVMRVLNRSSNRIGIERLEMSEYELKQLKNIIASPHGIMLVTGPTGSGKSTTLYTILSELNSEDKNIITVEDPVEYMLDGINQVNVNTKAGLTFTSGLRSILRQDPDIIMIGEIRDAETAEIAVRAAITGHLVLSTLHTNDAPSSILRLIDMGIEPYLAATSICGIVAQRLVKKVCPKCRESYVASVYEKKILGLMQEEELTLYKGKGCGYCKDTGYIGRMGVYEIMEITREHKDAIISSNNSEILKEISIKNGMRTLEQACRELVLKGVTTVEELVKIAFL